MSPFIAHINVNPKALCWLASIDRPKCRCFDDSSTIIHKNLNSGYKLRLVQTRKRELSHRSLITNKEKCYTLLGSEAYFVSPSPNDRQSNLYVLILTHPQNFRQMVVVLFYIATTKRYFGGFERKWRGWRGSNPQWGSQSPLCYLLHYIPLYNAPSTLFLSAVYGNNIPLFGLPWARCVLFWKFLFFVNIHKNFRRECRLGDSPLSAHS